MTTQTVYLKDGSMDKQYSVTVDDRNVLLSWGRRGGTMQTKTETAATPEAAQQLGQKKLGEKLSKGYRLGENGTAIVAPKPKSETAGGLVIAPMLLNEVTQAEAEELLTDPNFCAQVKWDGVRCQLQRIGEEILAFSRTNKPIALPQNVVEAMSLISTPGDIVFDGELIGEQFFVFDLIQWGRKYTEQRYHDRLIALYDHARFMEPTTLNITPTAYTTDEKRAMMKTLREHGAEGIVFKRLDVRYSPGRPNSYGPALKLKFVATASVIVVGPNGTKRSVNVMLADGTPLGSVTIPVNREVPSVGAIVECRYLYCYRGGSLVQAVYLGEREDVEREECTIEQLQFKGEVRK